MDVRPIINFPGGLSAGGRPTGLSAAIAVATLTCAFALQGKPASADDQLSAAGANAADEIVVTATKRATDLATTPLAVTVLSGEFLDNNDERDFDSYFRQVPGLAAIDNGPGRKRYILRGVNSQQSGMSVATVAQYIDDVPITNSFDLQPDPRLVDIDRVEVLRGPQGTLFGAQSMAGTIRTITRKPELDTFEGNATATLSDTDDGGLNENLEGVVNLPLGGTVAARVSAYYSYDDGYIDDVFPGGTFTANPAQLPPGTPPQAPVTLPPVTKNNFNDDTFLGGRSAVRWQPNDRLTVDFSGLGQKTYAGAPPAYDPAATAKAGNNLVTSVLGNSGNHDTLLLASGTADYTLDSATVTAVGAYSRRDNFVQAASPATGALSSGGPNSSANFGGVTQSDTFEVRAASTDTGRWQWLVGAYAFHQTQYADARQVLGFGNIILMDILSTNINREFAGFGELSFAPIDRLKITAGLRYSNERSQLDQDFVIPPPGGIIKAGPYPNPPRFSEDSKTPKFTISYETTDGLFTYATASEGFRPGGFNPAGVQGAVAIPAYYQSDNVWNYEVGAKSSFLDRRLTVDSALYRIDWNNLQAEGVVSGQGPMPMSYTTNASSARIIGLEIETTARLSDALSADLSFNHFFEAQLTRNAPLNSLGFQPLAGEALPYDAGTSFDTSLDYTTHLTPILGGFAHVEWSYTGARTTGFTPLLQNGQPNNAFNSFSPYDLINLRVGVTTGPWRASLFLNNVADARPVLQQTNYAPVPLSLRVTAQPRTVGITVNTNF